MGTQPIQVDATTRFEFGANWSQFLHLVDEERIVAAERSLQEMLGVTDLNGKKFLDIGSGSGLFSLAARRLGASVVSFDYDNNSVACAEELRQRYLPGDRSWRIEQGSALDESYLATLRTFDVVYSWGVLHHTGDMWTALKNAGLRVGPGGRLFISLYNDQGWISSYWTRVKKLYNTNRAARNAMIAIHVPYLIWLRLVVRFIKGRGKLERGMSLWHDMKDWLGGYPFEVSKPDAVIGFYAERGFKLVNVKTNGRRSGCNEFVFEKLA